MFDRRSQAVIRDVEIDECASHKDSGGMDLLVESVLAIDEENVETLPGEQASTLKSCQSGTDDSHVVACSHVRIAKSFVMQSSKTKKGRDGRH